MHRPPPKQEDPMRFVHAILRWIFSGADLDIDPSTARLRYELHQLRRGGRRPIHWPTGDEPKPTPYYLSRLHHFVPPPAVKENHPC